MSREMSREELVRKAMTVMDRAKDLQKFDLIKAVCESYSKGEFGDDPEMVAPSVLALIGGIMTNDASKVRKAMATLKTEKFLKGLDPHKLETFGNQYRGTK